MEIGHTRTGHEQSRREQALLQDELADRALRDSRVRSFHKLKELKREQEFRLEEFSIRKLVDFLRCRICTQWRIISRSNSTSVMSSSPWNRKIAKPRLKFAAKYLGHAWKIGKHFCKSKASSLTTYSGMPNHLNWFLYYGRHSGASEHGETRDRKWWLRQQQPILSQLAKIPNSFSIFSSKRKRLEERFERKDGASSPFENNLNRSAGLNGNCTTPSSCEFGKKCAWMHHQIGEQSSQKPKWKLRKEEWLKFSGKCEHVWQLVKNTSGRRAAEVFMETTEEHKVLRPIKHESRTVTEKRSIARGNWFYRASWRRWCTKIRYAPAEKRRESKVQRSSTRTEMLFLWCFSTPFCEREF